MDEDWALDLLILDFDVEVEVDVFNFFDLGKSLNSAKMLKGLWVFASWRKHISLQ
jgi:hypothetical protein